MDPPAPLPTRPLHYVPKWVEATVQSITYYYQQFTTIFLGAAVVAMIQKLTEDWAFWATILLYIGIFILLVVAHDCFLPHIKHRWLNLLYWWHGRKMRHMPEALRLKFIADQDLIPPPEEVDCDQVVKIYNMIFPDEPCKKDKAGFMKLDFTNTKEINKTVSKGAAKTHERSITVQSSLIRGSSTDDDD